MTKKLLCVFGVVLLVTFFSVNVTGDELATKYEFEGVEYDSLIAAEVVMRNSLKKPHDPSIYDPTAKLIPYQGRDLDNGNPYHHYEFPTAALAVEDLSFQVFSYFGVHAAPGEGDCGECPIISPYGGDHCATYPNPSYCLDVQDLYDYFADRESLPGCPATWESHEEFQLHGNEYFLQLEPRPAEIQAAGTRSRKSDSTLGKV